MAPDNNASTGDNERSPEVAIWALGTAVVWCLLLLWGHYRNPIGLFCKSHIRFLSCAATRIPAYNQIMGVPWAVLGSVASVAALALALWSRTVRFLPFWLLAGCVPLGYLRGLELTVLRGLCPICWLVVLSWVLALLFATGSPRFRPRIAVLLLLFAVGIGAGVTAAPYYPDPDAELVAAITHSQWRFVDARDAVAAEGQIPADEGLVVVLREGCPYCHAYAARTLLRCGDLAGTIWMLPENGKEAPTGLAGGIPEKYPATRWVHTGVVTAEKQGFMTLKQLQAWVNAQPTYTSCVLKNPCGATT